MCRRVWALLFAWLVAMVPLHALNPAQALRQYGQQQWQTPEGLPQNSVHAICQTRDGYLWLATDGGLVRFDGVEFAVFSRSSTPALRSNLIEGLATTPDGALWAATGDGLVYRNQEKLSVFGTAEGLPSGPMLQVLPADAGHVWVVAPDLVYYGGLTGGYGARAHFTAVSGMAPPVTARDGTPVMVTTPDGGLWIAGQHSATLLRKGRVATHLSASADLLAIGHDGILWLATAGGLLRYGPGDTAPAATGMLADTPIRSMAALQDGSVAVATARGLALLQGGIWQWKTAAEGLPPGRIQRMYQDSRGALWIVAEGAIARYVDGHFETLQPRTGAAGVEAVYEDGEGDLWLGTDTAGLLELREQRFTTLSAAEGLPGEVVRTLLTARDGTVWAGTDGGGVMQLRGSSWQPFTTQQGLTSNTILSLAQYKDGSLAVGTPDGLDRLAAGHAVLAPGTDALPDDFIRSLLYDPNDDSLWIGTRRGLSHQTAAGIRTYTVNDGLGSDLVGALALDRQHAGALWIGTRGGLSRFENGQIRNLTTREQLSSNVITALSQDSAGALWIGSNGGGLSVLRGGHVQSFPLTAGLPEVIHSIVEDGQGRLWLGAATGIYRVPRQQLESYTAHPEQHLDVAAYGVPDGMRINECSSGHPAAVRTRDGELWFATLRGISITDPEHAQENQVPPPVQIENVTVDDQPMPADSALRVRASHTRVSMHYAGLSFVAPARVRYRYRLQGFDPGWVDAGTRRVAYYTNIPPGHYTFQVMAANNDGVWNETGATLEVRVLPHLYQTWWFRTLLLLATCLLGYQLYRMRVRNVELRFNAVLAERTRIAREIHDTLAQDIVGISVQLELVARLLGSSVEAARTQLDAARVLVKSSLAGARSSIWNLRSAAADAEDLPARMARAVNQTAAMGTARLIFAVKGTARPAPHTIEDQLLRVAQEAVHNAVRHAEASHIHLTLQYGSSAVELVVEDDGRGFTMAPALFESGGHFGLKGMRERAQEIGGVLSVESEPGRGTRISLRVDIP